MAARMSKRRDGRYVVKVSYTDPQTGLKRRVPCYGRTQAEANEKAAEARARLAAGAPARDASCTLAQWLDEWQSTFLANSDRATATKTLYAGLCSRWIVPTLGQVRLNVLKPADVVRLLQAMEAAGKSASTRRNCYAALRGAVDDAVANGLLMSNPVAKVKRPKVSRREARRLTPSEAQRFMAAAEKFRYGDALKLILGTGLRRGEALALRWEDVDLERAEARVCGSLVRQDGVLRVSDTKTDRSRRTVALSASMLTVLEARKAQQAQERLNAGHLWSDAGFVFSTEFGRPADPRNLLRAVKVAAEAAGLEGVDVHALRHTYATVALLAGVPLHVVSRNLGHSSVAITGDIYAGVTDEAAQQAAAAVSAAYGL